MLLQQTAGSLLHLFFPHLCAGCGADLTHRHQVLCLHCMDRLPITNFHRYANNPAEMIFRGRLPLLAAMSYLYFTKSSLPQKLMHLLKYKGKKEIGLFFGNRIGEAIMDSGRFHPIDAILPLPLYATREKQRGFNQSALLSKGIAAQLRLPVLENVIARSASTGTQTHKNRMERWNNMAGKFVLQDAASIAHKHILLVDDVITTGATLEACGQELLHAANTRLSIATMACVLK